MENYANIPKEKFSFAQQGDISHDKKLQTKPRSYMRDAFSRFCKNKASVVAAIIVLILVLFALIGPFCINSNYTEAYKKDNDVKRYQFLSPRLSIFDGTGFWDGSKLNSGVNETTFYRYLGIEEEQGNDAVVSYKQRQEDGKTVYDVRVNTYYTIDVFQSTLTVKEYKALLDWQDENEVQVILPYVRYEAEYAAVAGRNLNIWYVCNQNGKPTLDKNGDFIPAYYTYDSAQGRRDDYTSKMRLEKDPYDANLAKDDANNHGWSYAQRTGTAEAGYNYVVRVNAYNYFQYKYGFKPSFAFGTDTHGYDIFTRLASGARFSLLFALAVSVINLIIGAIYGAIEGYYGGAIDLTMERISDVLSALPTMVITILFNLHLSGTIGTIPALLYAFIVTGWIGIASTTRMQFYRFKNQEYVLAARTLGARDRRIIWRHIFPNSLGTLVTSSVLIIPGVIFSETSLTYLGIINLDSPTQASVGAMLSSGQSYLTQFPHLILFPALFLALLEISFNLFGNGLRDAFNPTLRGSEG